MASIDKFRTVIYHRPQNYKPNIYGSAMNGASGTGALVNIEIPDWLNSNGVQFLYLWQPGI